jgi:hypothetical protein
MASAEPCVQAWERQEGEPEGAYEAFKGYVYQTPPRRLVHSSVKHGSAELSALYNEWRWQERALAWDRHIQRARDEEREALLREDEKSRTAAQLTMLKGIQQVANREIAKLVRDTAKSEAFGTVKVSDLNKLIGQVIVLERLIHGESTANVGVVDANLEKLSLDELRELQRLQAKLAGEDDDAEGATH